MIFLALLVVAAEASSMRVDLWTPAPSPPSCSTKPHVTLTQPAVIPGCVNNCSSVGSEGQVRFECNVPSNPAPTPGYVSAAQFSGSTCSPATWTETMEILPGACFNFGALASILGSFGGRAAASSRFTRQSISLPTGSMRVTCSKDGATVRLFSDSQCAVQVANPPIVPLGCVAANAQEPGAGDGSYMFLSCLPDTPTTGSEGGNPTLLGMPQRTAVIIGVIVGAVLVTIAVTVIFILRRRRRGAAVQAMPNVMGFETTEDNEADILDDNDF